MLQDKYILTSMGILCGVCVWHAIIPLFKSDDASLKTAKKIDMWALIVCGSSYFLFHVCFFMYIYFVVSLFGGDLILFTLLIVWLILNHGII